MKAITVCVEYSDLLSITLPRNARHFSSIYVVTTSEDSATRDVVASVSNASCFVTDAFYRNRAHFNKGLAIEEAFDYAGRDGWLCVIDADTLLPAKVNWNFLTLGNLYTPVRHMLEDPAQFSDALCWDVVPALLHEQEWAGYCQIFHAQDQRLRARRPWYGTTWTHAGGCDTVFQKRWPGSRKLRPPFHVLHLGQERTNWCGRVTPDVFTGERPHQEKNRRDALQKVFEDRRKFGTTHEHIRQPEK